MYEKYLTLVPGTWYEGVYRMVTLCVYVCTGTLVPWYVNRNMKHSQQRGTGGTWYLVPGVQGNCYLVRDRY